ncbi:MAG TPA: glutamine--fructose-6-phosphate transaminase (isomerizing) [Solirubrobacter sp.]|nr:glutamine--fructose-6-phosphate transaminase (isomerizing) [Solirubrobacter sp.]
MCGIIGYTGRRRCLPLLLDGLSRLEYRGYDSAGVALEDGPAVVTVRAVGNLDALRTALGTDAHPARTGIGHTRWATHGRVCEANAHPLSCGARRVHVVLNGIVENHVDLRRQLRRDGVAFASDTDAEVVAHLVATHDTGDLTAAVHAALAELDGHFAFVVLAADAPGVLVGTRRQCPLVIGAGAGEAFLASAVSAFLPETRQVVELADGEVATLRPDGVSIDGRPRAAAAVGYADEVATRDGYATFMEKEIHEQPAAVGRTLLAALDALDEPRLRTATRLRIVACGTSLHAGLAARPVFERWAALPTDVEVASEYRYREPLPSPGELVLGISQSGETADTLAALRSARDRGARVLALTNAESSQLAREADLTVLTRAGLEVGVAATKTFTSQVAALTALALRAAELRGAFGRDDAERVRAALATLPGLIEETLAGTRAWAERLAAELAAQPAWMYLGRHAGHAVALEGALKLKELSYRSADAYPAGEMKHGPIAQIGVGAPVVCVATESPVRAKLLSNVAEVAARGARVLAVANAEEDGGTLARAEDVATVPHTPWELQAPLAVIPLQLLALRVAETLGLNVDQPRNLAKTVTVE